MFIRSKPLTRSRSLLRTLRGCVLVACMLASFWQWYRTRRSVRETYPPEPHPPLPDPLPHITIILPVRNEAAHIESCLASLLAQDYPALTILVIDDGSTDATPALLAAWCRRDERVQVRRIEHLPDGWAGKAHALHTGVLSTTDEWLLFTDADTCHEPGTLRLMLGHALQQQDDLLSMRMNVMTLIGPATPFLVPTTEILLAQRATPAEIKDPRSQRAFAFGQYMLLRRSAYLDCGGYGVAGMRTSAVEDLALAEQLKQSGKRVEVVNGRGLLHNRQWTTWKSARQGWGKGCYSEIVRSSIPLAGLPAALALIIYGLVPSGALVRVLLTRKAGRVPALLGTLTLLAQITARRQIDRQYELPWLWSLTAPLAWVVCGVMALDVTRVILTDQRATWKGRRIPRQERAARVIRRRQDQSPIALNTLSARSYEDVSSGDGSASAGESA